MNSLVMFWNTIPGPEQLVWNSTAVYELKYRANHTGMALQGSSWFKKSFLNEVIICHETSTSLVQVMAWYQAC